MSETRASCPTLGSVAGGALLGIGWLLWIDSATAQQTQFGESVPGGYWVPGILQTLSLFMVNAVNWSMLIDDPFDDAVSSRVKAWVFAAFMLAFSGLFGALWILIAALNHSPPEDGRAESDVTGPAARCLLQNLFVFGGSLTFRLVRTRDE